MNVVKAFPPNYRAIRAAFPHIRGRAIIFAFGDRIYNPGGGKLEPALLAHEEVHCARQCADPAGWWSRYLADREFRIDEEVLAHRAEYQSLVRDGASAVRIEQVAARLSSPLYGARISLDHARALVST